MSNLKIGCSPLTSKIYVGKVLKSGVWANGKQDITDEAVSAVAQHLLQKDELFRFDYDGKTYDLKVVKIDSKP